MIRRSPTRINLRLDDLAEYEAIKKEKEAKKESEKQQEGPFNPPPWGGKLTQNEIQQRVGYVPQTPITGHQLPRSNITL